ncbi:MAG: hypothetical protein H7840_13960 [Alphaproteobacteria bacterium]
MSILVKSRDQYFELSENVLATYAISAEDYRRKSSGGDVGDPNVAWDQYADSVQIGCGCCMDKASYGASC